MFPVGYFGNGRKIHLMMTEKEWVGFGLSCRHSNSPLVSRQLSDGCIDYSARYGYNNGVAFEFKGILLWLVPLPLMAMVSASLAC